MAMSVEEARAALDVAEAKLAAATTTKEKIAASKEAATARKELTAANAAARAEARIAREEAAAEAAAKAEAERPKTGQEMAAQLKGVRPIIGAGESPDVVGGAGFPGYVDYKPLDEAARRAIFGYNPATGKAYTDAESAAISGGYNAWAGAIGYEIDPRTGNLNVLTSQGTVMTTGATYQYTPKGFIVPSDAYMEKFPGFGYDEEGRMVNAQGQLITQADIDTYNSLVQSDPNKAREFARGKGFSSSVINSGAVIDTSAKISTAEVNVVKNAAGNVVPLTTNTAQTSNAFVTPSGTQLTSEEYNKRTNAMSALISTFSRYGLESLVPKIREFAIEGAGEDTITLRLAETPEYQTRFAANQDRIKKGLRALTPAEYLNIEDDYRQILRAYGLKQFDNDAYVKQFISNDISTTELSNRVATAVQRVQNADPAVLTTLRSFYGISDNDLVAYVLDPNQQFQKIERQVAAAEIGAAAGLQGLSAGVAVSEQLAAQGITKAQAQKGYATIADILPAAEKLSDIYGGTLDEYRQNEAEQEVFNTLASAQRKRQKLIAREAAAFSGASGLSKSSLMSQIGGQI